MDAIKHSDEGAITFGILETMGRSPSGGRAAAARVLHQQGLDGRDQRRRTARADLARRDSGRGSLDLGAVLGRHADDRQPLQLRRARSRPGFLTDAGIVPDPQPLADAFRAELLALARRSRRIVA